MKKLHGNFIASAVRSPPIIMFLYYFHQSNMYLQTRLHDTTSLFTTENPVIFYKKY